MKKLSLMVILSVLTIVFSTPASFAKDVPEDKYTVPTKAEFSQIQQVLGNADIQTGNLKKDNGVIVNKPDEKVGIISDISDKKDAWSHVRFHSYYVDLNSDTLIADIRFTLKQNDDRTSTTEYKNVTNGGKYVVKHDKKGSVIYEKTTGDMSILWRY